jgi:hypothetical protein
MRRAGKYLVVAATVGAIGAAGSAFAFAADGWDVKGKGTFKAKVATMPKGVKPSVAKQGSTAVVSWSAQELVPGAAMDHYVVTAHNVDDPQADVAHTVAAGGGVTESLTFAAGEVAGGKWYWTIVPKYRSWVGEESGKSQRLTFPDAPAARLVSVTPTPTAQAVVAATAEPAATTAKPTTEVPATTAAPGKTATAEQTTAPEKTTEPGGTPTTTPAEPAPPATSPVPVEPASDASAPAVASG